MHRVIFCAVFALAFGVVQDASAQGGWMCYVREFSPQQGMSFYEVEDCSTGVPKFVIGTSGLTLGNCGSPSSPGCHQLPAPTSAMVIVHPGMSMEDTQKAQRILQEESEKFNSMIAKVIGFARREILSQD